jgi:hypothetical protein
MPVHGSLNLANPARNTVIARMIERHINGRLLAALDNAPAVALPGLAALAASRTIQPANRLKSGMLGPI